MTFTMRPPRGVEVGAPQGGVNGPTDDIGCVEGAPTFISKRSRSGKPYFMRAVLKSRPTCVTSTAVNFLGACNTYNDVGGTRELCMELRRVGTGLALSVALLTLKEAVS